MSIDKKIVNWLLSYCKLHNKTSLIVGISGGIDSSVVSALCAETGIETIVLSLPLHQKASLHDLSLRHGNWLTEKYKNVKHRIIDLSATYDSFVSNFDSSEKSGLSLANTKSRLRMVTLYQVAGNHNGLVVGTGNKVEDFGVGFFTKYGDGGVDISPIADLMKSEVWDIARSMGILPEIIDAPPTDGLWDDDRTDEDQLAASYKELEWAMSNCGKLKLSECSERQKDVMKIYEKHHRANLHKMLPIPVFLAND